MIPIRLRERMVVPFVLPQDAAAVTCCTLTQGFAQELYIEIER